MVSATDFISVDALLAILGIIIGLTIFLMQRRADSKISRIIETQFKRQELVKQYFGTRLISNVRLVIAKNHLKLAQYLSEYASNPSKANMNKVKYFCVFQSTNLDGFVVPALRNDLGHLIEFVDDPKLVDQLSIAFDDFAALFKDCSVESFFEEPDPVLAEKADATKKRAEMIDSLLSRFEQEIHKTV